MKSHIRKEHYSDSRREAVSVVVLRRVVTMWPSRGRLFRGHWQPRDWVCWNQACTLWEIPVVTNSEQDVRRKSLTYITPAKFVGTMWVMAGISGEWDPQQRACDFQTTAKLSASHQTRQKCIFYFSKDWGQLIKSCKFCHTLVTVSMQNSSRFMKLQGLFETDRSSPNSRQVTTTALQKCRFLSVHFCTYLLCIVSIYSS